MTNKFGPTRSELKFRLYVSIAGLAMLIGAIVFRGLPTGPAMFEVVAIAGAFFGGTLIWTLRKLTQKDRDDGL
ncbi:MAG: hypothetical protein AB8B47_05160 [Roseobacter sp.]